MGGTAAHMPVYRSSFRSSQGLHIISRDSPWVAPWDIPWVVNQALGWSMGRLIRPRIRRPVRSLAAHR